ncbi:MAG: M20/M25/M40 family metallo-hydrolase [Planctomycetota bacterium]|nr:M20/M25/M40 family metallo-hydrolase [Planctomycetota bacterium]
MPASRFALPRAHHGVLADADRTALLRVVTALLSTPTAPYFEDGMLAVVRALAAEIPGVTLRSDEHGNLIARRTGSGSRTLAFSAHLDHPGFHPFLRRGRAPAATLHGGVPMTFLPGAELRFHDARSLRSVATARVATAAKGDDDLVYVELEDVRGVVEPGSFGVFDLPGGVMRGTRLSARVCDDLLGAAAILVALAILAREGHPRPLAGIFTRAEETGFVGCIGLLESGVLGKQTSVVGLECSPRRATAKVGRGPVVRVGDRLSVFDPELTHGLQDAASRVKARAPQFAAQRALMDGGSCESTAYNAWGVPAGGACLALGNYHNCGPDGGIAAEFVDWNDLEGLVALLVEMARGFDTPGAVAGASGIRARLIRNWERESGQLSRSSARLCTPARTAARKRRSS